MKIEYDYTNIFREIIDGQAPCKKYKETKHTLVIFDITPKFKTHLLVLPKESYINFHHMMESAPQEEILDFFYTINSIINSTDLIKGYQIYSNTEKNHGQEVDHFHMHLISHFKV